MEKIKYAIYRFLQGRYGTDKLNTFLLFTSVFFFVLNMLIFKNQIANIVLYAFLILTVFRSYSKNIYKRRKENQAYLNLTRPIRSRINLIKKRMKDRNNRYFLCPNCKQIVRVPKGRGKIEIACPKCKTKFTKRS